MTKNPLHSHHIHRRSSLTSSRGSLDEAREETPVEDETTIEPDQGNVLSHIISQLRPGADLSRVTLPTFILEPRSMLERITNFMAHPDTLLPMPQVEDPLQRFISVVKFYLSGWHIRPPGVKKPLNPVLGETYTCYWDYPDGSRGYYISEQTSHHPPKSSYFFMAPSQGIRVDGTLKPRSKFLGNSAASLMEGISYLRLMNLGSSSGGEKYIITQPNMYARGILFGKMKYELGDHSSVRCPENDLAADLEFKTKGYFSGTYNAIGGIIKRESTGEALYELSGLWNGEMFIKDMITNQRELLFDATNAKHAPPKTRPMAEQSPRESQALWHSTVLAVNARDHEKATEEKSKIEERQREEASKRAEDGLDWRPRLFRPVKAGQGESEEGEGDLDWILNSNIDGKDAPTLVEQILAVAPILPGQRSSPEKFPIPPHSSSFSKSPTKPTAPSTTSKQENLIDFAQTDGAANDSVPATKSASSQRPSEPQRNRSMSLLDDDSHIGDVNKRMGSMNLMEPLKSASSTKTAADEGSGGTRPDLLERLDTETSEVDAFFDAEN